MRTPKEVAKYLSENLHILDTSNCLTPFDIGVPRIMTIHEILEKYRDQLEEDEIKELKLLIKDERTRRY